MLLDLKNIKNKYGLDIKGIIHIGAHYGEEINIYEELSINELIFFEPLSDNFNKLVENIDNKGYTCIKTALGNSTGQIEMYVESANNGQSSSILKPKKHLTQYPHIIFNEKEVVNIDKLDNISFNRENYNLINIDVQGFELEVFKGAEDTLKYIDYILTEVNRDEVYENCPHVSDLDDYLGKYGFNRVETTWDGITWGDALYLKQ